MYHRIEGQRNLEQNPKNKEQNDDRNQNFYAPTSRFSTGSFKSEKPTEVPDDYTLAEREVVWNPALEKLSEGHAYRLYRRLQAAGQARIDFPQDRAVDLQNLPETLETLTKAGVKELTISHEWSNWQGEFRTFLRAGWKIADSINLPDYRPGTTRPALLLIHG